jgi:hypothetical protein
MIFHPVLSLLSLTNAADVDICLRRHISVAVTVAIVMQLQGFSAFFSMQLPMPVVQDHSLHLSVHAFEQADAL